MLWAFACGYILRNMTKANVTPYRNTTENVPIIESWIWNDHECSLAFDLSLGSRVNHPSWFWARDGGHPALVTNHFAGHIYANNHSHSHRWILVFSHFLLFVSFFPSIFIPFWHPNSFADIVVDQVSNVYLSIHGNMNITRVTCISSMIHSPSVSSPIL